MLPTSCPILLPSTATVSDAGPDEFSLGRLTQMRPQDLA